MPATFQATALFRRRQVVAILSRRARVFPRDHAVGVGWVELALLPRSAWGRRIGLRSRGTILVELSRMSRVEAGASSAREHSLHIGFTLDEQVKLLRDEDCHLVRGPRDVMTKLEAERWDKDSSFTEVPSIKLAQTACGTMHAKQTPTRTTSICHCGIECTLAAGGITTTSSCFKPGVYSRLQEGQRTRYRESASNAFFVRQHVSSFGFWEVSGPEGPLAVAGKAARIASLLSRNQIGSEVDPF